MALDSPRALVYAAPPLDFSFKELRACAQIETEEPRNSKRPQEEEKKEESVPKMVIRRVMTSVKLNNNILEQLNGLANVLETAMSSPLQNLQWLDISFNSLTNVDPELLKFVHLKALYLHGNCIQKFGSVQRLQKLPKLRLIERSLSAFKLSLNTFGLF